MNWIPVILVLVAAMFYAARSLRTRLSPSVTSEAGRIKAEAERALTQELSETRKQQRELDEILALPDPQERLRAMARYVRRNR